MKKIMIIEDNELHTQLIKTLLKNTKAEIFAFVSAIEAIEWLETNPIDIILVDIQLPLLSGVEFLNFIKKKESMKNTKCYAITAQKKFMNKSFHELGFDGHFPKPLNIKVFLETINNSI